MSQPILLETAQDLSKPAPLIILGMINSANDTSFTMLDLGIGPPSDSTEEGYDTTLTVTALGTTSWDGSKAINYNRLDLAKLFGATGMTIQVWPEWTTTVDLLPYINAQYGLAMSSDDIVKEPLVAAPGTQTINAKPTSLIYKGTFAGIALEVIPPDLSLTGQIPDITDAHPNHNSTYQFTIAGGKAPYAVSISGPAGWTIDNTGKVTIPNKGGMFAYLIGVTDAAGKSVQYNGSMRITLVQSPSLTLTGDAPDLLNVDGTTTSTYPYVAAGGVAPYAFAFVGAAPTGWSLGATNGVMTIPHTAGDYDFQIQVTDADGTVTTLHDTVKITLAAALTITGDAPDLPHALAGKTDTYQYTLAGGKAPYVVAFDGQAPAGWSVTTTGLLTIPHAAGTFAFTLKVTDANGTVAKVNDQVVITMVPTLTLTNQAPASLVVSQDGGTTTYTFAAAGGTAPYAYALANGATFDHLRLDAQSGVMTVDHVTESYTASVVVTDADGTTAQVNVTLAVRATAPLTLTGDAPDVADAKVGDAYSYTGYVAGGGTTPYAWALLPSSENVPSWMSLNPTTGELHGTIEASATMTLDVQITDADGFTKVLHDIVAITVPAP